MPRGRRLDGPDGYPGRHKRFPVKITPELDDHGSWPRCCNLCAICRREHWCRSRLQGYQDQGRIGHIGLSGHNETVALEVVRSGMVDLLMFPVNLVGHDDERNRAILRACAEADVGLVAMKPYHGGTLLFGPPTRRAFPPPSAWPTFWISKWPPPCPVPGRQPRWRAHCTTCRPPMRKRTMRP